MSTCHICGVSFANNKALYRVSSSIIDSTLTLPNDTDSPHSTKRLTMRLSAPTLNARRDSQLRMLCAHTRLLDIHSGVPPAAGHLLRKKSFTIIGRPNMHSGVPPAASHLARKKRLTIIGWPYIHPSDTISPDPSTSAINVILHCALQKGWNNIMKKCTPSATCVMARSTRKDWHDTYERCMES